MNSNIVLKDIKDIYSNKKQNIHFIIIFLIFIFIICVWPIHNKNESFSFPQLPLIIPAVTPIVLPTFPKMTKYISKNNDIKDALDSSYNAIKDERNINLDNQERVNNLGKRITNIKLELIDLKKKSQINVNDKPLKFY